MQEDVDDIIASLKITEERELGEIGLVEGPDLIDGDEFIVVFVKQFEENESFDRHGRCPEKARDTNDIVSKNLILFDGVLEMESSE